MKGKITLKKALILGMFLGIQQFSFGQTFFTEDFEGNLDVATGLPIGWTETGLSTDGIYSVGTDAEANAGGFFPAPAHTLFAMTNDDVCDCDKSADRLILPVQDLSTYAGTLKMFYSTVSDNQYTDIFTIEVSTDGGTTWTNVQTIATTNTTFEWQDLNINLSAYLGMSNVMISFLYNDNAAWGSGMAIDDVSLAIVIPETQIAIQSLLAHPYSIMPLSQNPSIDVSVNIINNGDLDIPNYDVISNVYLSTDLVNPVQTYTFNGTNLVMGASQTVAQGTYTPLAVGDYRIVNEVIAAGDVNLTNNMMSDSITISNAEFARDLGNLDGGPLGGGAGTDLVLGQTFDFTNRVKLDSVFFIVAPTVVGGTISVQVSNVVAGFPELTPIGMSIDLPVDQAMVDEVAANGLYFVQIPITDANGQALMLDPGTYFIGIHETADADLMGLQHASGIISPASYFVSLDGAAYQDVAVDFGFDDRTPIIRAYVYEGVFINSSSATNTICGTGTIDLSSTEASGNQWFLDGNALPGETNQTLTVSAPGDYSVSANSFNSDITTVI